MTSKPLKTVEHLLMDFGRAYKKKQPSAVGVLREMRKTKADLDAHYYQLMLSLVPKTHGKDGVPNYDEATVSVLNEFRQKLSEHFNGEGV